MDAFRTIPGTDLNVYRLCLGGNVLGWTADREASFAVLDRYHEAGGNFLDTADSYSAWVPGNSGGESETILGEWLQRSGARDEVVLATKVGGGAISDGLSRPVILQAAEDSLRRLRTDRIDLYYAHRDDPTTPLEETLGAFATLIEEGKVRFVAASNFSAERLRAALDIAAEAGVARYVALQPSYNLVERRGFEDELQGLCEQEGIGCIPYFGLASGFLTGKYRPGAELPESPRAGAASEYLSRGGEAVLTVLDELAAGHRVPPSAVALAWLGAQPTVVAPIASARSIDQLDELLTFPELELAPEELVRLGAASNEVTAQS